MLPAASGGGESAAARRRRRRISVSEAVCKPSSVPSGAEAPSGDGHPSGAAGCPTAHAADPRAGQRTSPPTGCPARVAPSYLALLRVEFAAFHSDRRLAPMVGIVTVALVLVSRRTGVTRHPALRSSDFPHALHGVAPDVARSHPTASLTAAFYRRRSAGPDLHRERGPDLERGFKLCPVKRISDGH